MNCRRCGTVLEAGDAFCGGCGLPAADAIGDDRDDIARPGSAALRPARPEMAQVAADAAGPGPASAAWPAVAPAPGARSTAPLASYASGPPASDSPVSDSPAAGRLAGELFSHEPASPFAGAAMTNATRYLCAAAYLAPSFANTVISELIGSHRAVAPSRGIDLVPVIRHCLQARRMQLMRDLQLIGILLLGIALARGALILFLIVAFFCGLLPGGNWERKSMGGRLAAGAAALGGLALVAAVAFVFLVLNAAHSYGLPGLPTLGWGPLAAIIGLVYWGVLAGVLFSYSRATNQTLGNHLSHGATAQPLSPLTDRVENRIAEVARAQHGNLTLYDGQNPFIGAGITPFTQRREDERVWSIAIELNRAEATRAGGPPSLLGHPRGGRVEIDPVELHEVLRERLEQLGDTALPASQRLKITVDHQVVGEGYCRWDSPLIDQRRKIPYSRADAAAVTELIRNPQAGLRCYLRASVSDEGSPVLAGAREVIGGVDQEVIVSAYVYVAVEGRMFYLQFVPAALAPVLAQYHSIDRLPRLTSGKFLAKAAVDAMRTSFRDILRAPVGVLSTLLGMWAQHRAFQDEITSATDYVYADIGARISVRELGASLLPRTYIQRLDASKYTQMIERLVIEAVLDYLDAQDVDTTAYRRRAEAIYNSGTIVAGNIQGTGIAVGHNATASVS